MVAMFNKKNNAIKTLNNHLRELDIIKDVKQGNNWKSKFKDTLNLYIGEDSAISKRLDSLFFTRKEVKIHERAIGFYEEHIYDEAKKDDFRDLIKNAIGYINSNGIYKSNNRKNFLGSFGNTEIIGGIVVAAGIIYSIGNYFGKFEKEREIIRLDLEMKKIENQKNEVIIENEKLKKTIIDLNKIENDSNKKVNDRDNKIK